MCFKSFCYKFHAEGAEYRDSVCSPCLLPVRLRLDVKCTSLFLVFPCLLCISSLFCLDWILDYCKQNKQKYHVFCPFYNKKWRNEKTVVFKQSQTKSQKRQNTHCSQKGILWVYKMLFRFLVVTDKLYSDLAFLIKEEHLFV